MNIVTAGVHYARILRAKFHTAALLNRQRVDVCAQGNLFLALTNFGDDPGLEIVRQHGDPGPRQPLAQTGGGFDFLP
ncbi:hypothetical protein D3C71_2171710 [compost metagenome]